MLLRPSPFQTTQAMSLIVPRNVAGSIAEQDKEDKIRV
jgi:hypothetical protein